MDSDDNFSYGDDYSYDYGDYEYDDNSFGYNEYDYEGDIPCNEYAYEGDTPRYTSWDYDSDDDFHHRSVITSPIAQTKSPKHAYLVSFSKSLKPVPSSDFLSLPPNQNDKNENKPSFVHLIEVLLKEDMNSPFASSLIDYGMNRDITFFLDVELEDIN